MLRELRKSLVIPDRIEVMNSGFFNALRIVSRDTALDRGPPRAVLKSIIKNRISIIDYQKSIIKNRISIIDYQKSIIKNRISKIDYQIDCQRSFTCKSKINCKKSIIKNRSSKIDFILDAHAYHILPEFCRKRRSIMVSNPFPLLSTIVASKGKGLEKHYVICHRPIYGL